MDEHWIAWAAGFIDGEGAVMLPYSRPSIYRRNGRTNNKPGQVYVHLRVGQSLEAPLLKFVSMFGSYVKTIHNEKKYTKPFYEWNTYGASAIEVLKVIRPYLLVKDVHADVAIRYFEECNGIVGNLDRRLEYHAVMRALQQKGGHLQKEVTS